MSGASRSTVCVRGTPLVDPFHHTRIIEVPTIIPHRSVIEERELCCPLYTQLATLFFLVTTIFVFFFIYHDDD